MSRTLPCSAASITASARAVRKFLKKQGIERADMIVVAGGAKTLASPRNDFEQDFILEQVRMSIRLHQTKRVLVMSHSDCATYGGLAHFKGDRAAEAAHHRSELLRAGELLTTNFPGISVEPYFVKFDGIWEVNQAGICGRKMWRRKSKVRSQIEEVKPRAKGVSLSLLQSDF